MFVNHVWNWLFGAGIVRRWIILGPRARSPRTRSFSIILPRSLWKKAGARSGWCARSSFPAPGSSPWRVRILGTRRIVSWRAQPQAARRGGNSRHHSRGERPLQLDYLGPNIAGAGDIDPNTTGAQNIEYGLRFKDTRRSVYTPAFRNKRLELFEAFDFGDINSPMGQRNVSTVAPQALFFLNHPFVVDQARAAAERTLALPENERLISAFRRTLGRAPFPAELKKCQDFLASKPSASLEDWGADSSDPVRLHRFPLS